MVVVDAVAIPNSFYTVTKHINDRFHYSEFGQVDFIPVQQWTVKQIPEGYYDAISYAKAIEAALNLDRLASSAYTVTFNSLRGAFEIHNSFPGNQDYMSVLTRELLLDSTKNQDFGFDVDYSNLMDNCREMGMVHSKGNQFSVSGGYDQGNTLIMLTAPTLQPHVNLFIKSPNIGMPASNLGPGGSMTILRRVVMQAPTLGIELDRHTSHYDSVRIAPQIISSFKIELCGFDGNAVNLQGLPWAFSMVVSQEINSFISQL